MNYSLEIDESSIVVLGTFNPAIFHPFWFNAKGLIKPEEAETSKIEVTHPTLTIFSMEWCKLQVEPNRFIIQAVNPLHFDLIEDLTLGTFSLLESTPANAIGINRMMHFKLESREKIDAFGDMIAPKEVWKEFMHDPGVANLVMVDPKEKANRITQITVQKSTRLECGVFIAVNNHFEIEDKTAKTLINILKESWQDSIKTSAEKANLLLDKVKI
jgi:hypothetical protein